MMVSVTPMISVKCASIPGDLLAFMDSLVGLLDDPASLYVSADSRSLVVYVELALTINVINLSQLNIALCQENKSALALKSLIETGPPIKVFFDARMPARTLFDRCGIKLAAEV